MNAHIDKKSRANKNTEVPLDDIEISGKYCIFSSPIKEDVSPFNEKQYSKP